MTTTGFQSFLPGGAILQITDTFFNYSLISKGNATTVTPTTQGGTSKLVVPLGSVTNPLVVLQPSDDCGYMFGSTFVTNMAVGTVVPYWIFDSVPAAAPAHDTGLQLFNSAGASVYSSSQKQLRVVDFVDPGHLGGSVFSFPAGPSYAIGFPTSAGRRKWERGTHPGLITDWWNDAYVVTGKVSGHTVTCAEIEHSWDGPHTSAGTGNYNLLGSLMVVDVTNQ